MLASIVEGVDLSEVRGLFLDQEAGRETITEMESLLEAIEYAQSSEVDERWRDIAIPEDAPGINQAQ